MAISRKTFERLLTIVEFQAILQIRLEPAHWEDPSWLMTITKEDATFLWS